MRSRLKHLLNITGLFLTHLAAIVTGEQARYDGFQVLRLAIRNPADDSPLASLLHSDKFDFWDYPNDVMTSPEDKGELIKSLEDSNVSYHVWIEDVQRLIDAQHRMYPSKRSAVDEFDYSVYHTYGEIDQWMQTTAANYPNLVQEILIGRSYEKRAMRVLKVGSTSDSIKPALWIQSGIHAREWIAPATNVWMTKQLLDNYGSDPDVTDLLDTYDFYILPIINPDGYDFTWTTERLWRKTRSVNFDSFCVGTDANRNWAYHWGGLGGSPNPCSSTYRGHSPQSEVEVRNIVDFITERGKTQDFVFFLDIHSYSQMWLTPWGYTEKHPDDYDTQMKVGQVFSDAVQSTFGTQYLYGTVPDLLYLASGCSIDWAYGNMNTAHVYSIELRDMGLYGFLLPEDQIIPTGEETFHGMVATLTYLKSGVLPNNEQ